MSLFVVNLQWPRIDGSPWSGVRISYSVRCGDSDRYYQPTRDPGAQAKTMLSRGFMTRPMTRSQAASIHSMLRSSKAGLCILDAGSRKRETDAGILFKLATNSSVCSFRFTGTLHAGVRLIPCKIQSTVRPTHSGFARSDGDVLVSGLEDRTDLIHHVLAMGLWCRR
jgi:hypothetical protein